jgi:glycosyltransferase involved in cell wall biosynthesis
MRPRLSHTARDRMPDLRLLVLSAGTQVRQNVLATLAARRAATTVIATSSVDIVVTDDSAGPEIASIVASRGSQRPVRYQRNPTRLRPRGNFIRCFEEARGEFVKFVCDDDVLAPACVEQLVDAFRRAPDVTLATSVAHASTKRACDCPICRRRSRSSAKAASSPGTRSRTPC